MDERELELLEHISASLDELLAVAKKPKSRVVSVFEFIAVVVGTFSIVGIIDTVGKWLFGG